MTTEELLGQLYDQTLLGNKPAVLGYRQRAARSARKVG